MASLILLGCVLLCPLMMVVMMVFMRGHDRQKRERKEQGNNEQ